MSSANINVGIEGRASSRVSKPPGGAHTDIFGVSSNPELGNTRFMKQSVKSSINECFDYKNSPQNKQAKENGDEKNEEIHSNDENSKPIETSSISARVRIPPGGFSSALW